MLRPWVVWHPRHLLAAQLRLSLLLWLFLLLLLLLLGDLLLLHPSLLQLTLRPRHTTALVATLPRLLVFSGPLLLRLLPFSPWPFGAARTMWVHPSRLRERRCCQPRTTP